MLERLGVTFASLPALGVVGAVEVAGAAQELGYRSFWTAETTGAESFALLGAIGAVAPGLDLGTGIVPMQVRTPQIAAIGAATLQALHPERDIYLGIGISSPVVTGQWHVVAYGDRPLARVREYVALVRACLSGEAVTFDGEFWSAKRFRLGVRLGERRPKIVIGALNQGMLRLAGEVADGVLLNYVPAAHVPWCVKQVRTGGDATIFAYVHAGAVADRSDGIDAARRDLYSYAVVDSYAASFRAAGFGDEVAELCERFATGDRDGAVQAVSDRMVDDIDFMGTPNEVHRFLSTYVDAGVEVPVLMPLPWGKDRMAVTTATLRAAAGLS